MKKIKSKHLLISAIILFAIIIAIPFLTGDNLIGWGIKILSCSDEKGVDYYTPDKITLKYSTTNSISSVDYSDFCVDDSVVEYTCSGNKLKKEKFSCPYGCSNGACTHSVCTDSDGGKDYKTKGVAIFEGKIKEINIDYCLDAKKLNEYFCANQEEVRAAEYVCPQGCKNGACVGTSISCRDTDKGIDYSVKGSITSDGGVQSDRCIGRKLVEYYCTRNGLAMVEFYVCPDGCSNGACAS